VNPHEVLGVRPGASPREVRAAWRRKVLATHPDRGGDEAAFAEALDAYRALGGGSVARPRRSAVPVVFVRRSGPTARAARWWRRRRSGRTTPRVS
jgi:hypothetical protein